MSILKLLQGVLMLLSIATSNYMRYTYSLSFFVTTLLWIAIYLLAWTVCKYLLGKSGSAEKTIDMPYVILVTGISFFVLYVSYSSTTL
ncbi:hypothetical protein MUG87_19395 [Ectobacillus sp. JY-23]|uniref:hypothetical protein n=1 Tax=Ectobacillus sp. JY-23 TaxID=2933872 RepID=UPI001FF6A7E2|nr:hypothetical protein [Ectobacillus sp. JY-23]UOY92547.1 hypothetical protein MUG87_19395 [Ectobacillus sp. JY-23]